MIVLTPIRYFGEIKIWYFGYVFQLAVIIAFALTGHENYALWSYLILKIIFAQLEYKSDSVIAYLVFSISILIPISLIWLGWDWIYLMHGIGVLFFILGYSLGEEWMLLFMCVLIPGNFTWIYGPHDCISIFWLIIYFESGVLVNKIKEKSCFSIVNMALLLSVTITSYFFTEEYFEMAYSIVLVFVILAEYLLISPTQYNDMLEFFEMGIFLFNFIILLAGIYTYFTLFWIFIIFQFAVVFVEVANRPKYLSDLFDTTLGLILSWNTLDLARLVLCFCWAYLNFYSQTNNSMEIILIALTFVRGLTAFRCFNGTRYYVHLIMSSIRDIKFFLVIFFYSTISFGVISSYTNGNAEFSFQNSLITAYDMNLGNFSHTEDFSLGYFVFLCASIINVIIMLNLLISVLANSFENFKTIAAEIDFMEMADVLTEIEGLMIFRRSNSISKYFFVCDSDKKAAGEEGNAKIDEMSKKVDNGFEALEELGERIGNIEKSNSNTENTISEMNAKIDSLLELLKKDSQN
ncbi:hypothetical protein SteCoe_10974 [Stentor coeruleus]|uniref:Ion transport domain-containing protein n=1 Tax=Stentor coeruleus TaxID=5963 RepID=A0A1R2CEB4_9CILI|nr:hypothetical protein SteCoe_10974 [Stentor coeruleus]